MGAALLNIKRMNAGADNRTHREDLVLKLFDLFRRSGYDAVSIADISDATGLGKSSLYHHFPGGKPDMAKAVADFAMETMRARVFNVLKGEAPLADKIDETNAFVHEMYEGGGAPCLISSLMISPNTGPETAAAMRKIVEAWGEAYASALRQAGRAPKDAKTLAVSALVQIQGGLVIARATGDRRVFRNALEKIKRELAGD